jgi:hypothetical protein
MSDEQNCDDELLTRLEIECKYGLSFTTAMNMLESPQLQRHCIIKRIGRMYPRKEVEAFLKENKTERINKDE